jgi:hypothetical protein
VRGHEGEEGLPTLRSVSGGTGSEPSGALHG